MPHRQRWRRPFIYSPADIDTVIDQARSSIVSPLRAATYATLIGLLAASGMRIGEAIKLDRGDVDWAQGVLLIRESKFGKSRLVPLTASSMAALQDYAGLRDRAPAAARGAELLRLPHPETAALCRGLPDLPAARRRRRCRRRRAPPTAAARPAPHLRGPHPARLVSRGRGRRRPRSRRCRPTSDTASRAPPTGTSRPLPSCSRWPPPARTPRGRRPDHDPDRADAAGLLHRPAHHAAPGQPPHHRGLPRHPAAAARVRAPPDRQDRPPSWTGTTWTPR